MTNREVDQAVRRWIESYPGHFDGKNAGECIRKARGLNEGREGASSATNQSPDILRGVTVGPCLTRNRPSWRRTPI